ncbi:ATP-binding protein [Rhodoferax sp.]|uniref:ATP-binding protein n=1 Tax=Rhodoferax sp. TaxID=50421 RepID=UPI002603985A|nr:ATP-binding protein [Rhodoferax sp.]MDD5481130.1 ATP-binding protein [Rhodoferax sp.]
MSRWHPKHITLVHRLLVALVVVSVLFWAAIATLTTRDNIKEINALYDTHLAYTSKALLHLMDPDDDELQSFPTLLSALEVARLLDLSPNLPSERKLNPPAQPEQEALASTTEPTPSAMDQRKREFNQRLRYQLWRDNGQLLFRTDNAPAMHMATQPGFSDTQDAQGQGWRNYFVTDASHKVHMIVSEPHSFRQHLTRSLIISAATPLALGLPVLFLLLWFSVKRGLVPLAQLSHEIAMRKPDNLTPIDADKVPDEVRPIVTALNDLLTRMAHTLDNERQFTDDAAHQLRTPLAAIQAQLYTARHTRAGDTHQLALEQMQASVSRGIRLVNQLLTLARLDPKQAPPQLESVSLNAVAEAVCAELATLALQRQQTLELLAPAQVPPIEGNADLLAMLISNLLDNAIHYTPEGGQISLSLTQTPTEVSLCVLDNGPGIAAEQRSKVLERFYRVAAQHQPGTGLGLAICQRIAEIHHTTLQLSDHPAGSGLCVTVAFALQPTPPAAS